LSVEETKKRAILLGQRICEHIPVVEAILPSAGEELYKQIRRCLTAASEQRKLNGGIQRILKLLKSERSKNSFAIFGGGNREGGSKKDLKRRNKEVWFERDDGGLFTFSLTVLESKSNLTLHSYDFELWLPENVSPVFIRFDLNSPSHDNEKDGMRSHLHPGHDNLSVPCPIMSPVEALEIILYSPDLRFREKKREQPNALKNFASDVAAFLDEREQPHQEESIQVSQQTIQTLDKLRAALQENKGPAIEPLRLAAFILERYADQLTQELLEELLIDF
jgi:hypothetical protein